MSGRPVVGIVTGEYPPRDGGIGACAHGLALGLVERGVDVRVVAPRYADLATSGDLGTVDLHRVTRVYQGGIGPLRHLARAGALARIPAPARYVAMDWRAALSALPVARARRTPLSIWCHGTELLRYRASRVRPLMQAVLRASTQVVANSAYTRDLAIEAGVAPGRLVVVTPGTEMAAPDPCEVEALRARLGLGGRRIVLTFSRVVPRKGHDLVIRALPAVRRAVPDVVYVVAGGGDDVPRLRDLAGRLGVDDVVRFVGRVPADEKAPYYGLCDVFVMPSRQEGVDVEGFGISFVEAGVCGKPVIAGRHGGVPDAVRDGETGFLVDPASPAAVEDALLRLLADPAMAACMGRRGQQLVRDAFRWPTLADALVRTWRPDRADSPEGRPCRA